MYLYREFLMPKQKYICVFLTVCALIAISVSGGGGGGCRGGSTPFEKCRAATYGTRTDAVLVVKDE